MRRFLKTHFPEQIYVMLMSLNMFTSMNATADDVILMVQNM